jgi:putative membrane protein
MAFVDILAFWEVTILIGAVLLGYVGVLAYAAMRRNDPAGVKSALRGGAVPVGAIGAIATLLGVYSEMAWPLPGSYNILFADVYVLFGVTFLVLAVSMAFTLKLQYAGLLGLVAGGVTIAYGWNGYSLGMTKEPFQTFLLYGSFGLAGILALPSTIVVDYYLAHANGTSAVFGSPVSLARRSPSIQAATRATQPVVPGTTSSVPEETELVPKFRLPIYVSVSVVVFVVAVGLAAVAALFFVDSTLPAHLASAP